MKRKIVSILLVMLICFSMAIGVSASPDTDYVTDELGYLADSEIASLNQLAQRIYEERIFVLSRQKHRQYDMY